MRKYGKMILALIGIVVIGVVTIIASPRNTVEHPYTADSYYVPKDTVDPDQLRKILSENYSTRGTGACPVTAPASSHNAISVAGICAYSQYKPSYLLLGSDSLGPSTSQPKKTNEIQSVYGIGSGYTSKSGASISQLKNSKASKKVNGEEQQNVYYEIIAPFKFTFKDCINTSGRTVRIENYQQTVEIEIDNVANWFCAGEYSPPSTNLSNHPYDWTQHQTNHRTIIGSSAASQCTGGLAGTVIAYANDETTIKITANGESISMEDFYK